MHLEVLVGFTTDRELEVSFLTLPRRQFYSTVTIKYKHPAGRCQMDCETCRNKK